MDTTIEKLQRLISCGIADFMGRGSGWGPKDPPSKALAEAIFDRIAPMLVIRRASFRQTRCEGCGTVGRITVTETSDGDKALACGRCGALEQPLADAPEAGPNPCVGCQAHRPEGCAECEYYVPTLEELDASEGKSSAPVLNIVATMAPEDAIKPGTPNGIVIEQLVERAVSPAVRILAARLEKTETLLAKVDDALSEEIASTPDLEAFGEFRKMMTDRFDVCDTETEIRLDTIEENLAETASLKNVGVANLALRKLIDELRQQVRNANVKVRGELMDRMSARFTAAYQRHQVVVERCERLEMRIAAIENGGGELSKLDERLRMWSYRVDELVNDKRIEELSARLDAFISMGRDDRMWKGVSTREDFDADLAARITAAAEAESACADESDAQLAQQFNIYEELRRNLAAAAAVQTDGEILERAKAAGIPVGKTFSLKVTGAGTGEDPAEVNFSGDLFDAVPPAPDDAAPRCVGCLGPRSARGEAPDYCAACRAPAPLRFRYGRRIVTVTKRHMDTTYNWVVETTAPDRVESDRVRIERCPNYCAARRTALRIVWGEVDPWK